MSIKGLSHITLTVKNIETCAKFYSKLFDTEITVSETDDSTKKFNLRKAGVPISFRQYTKTPSKDSFDYSRIGLDHTAIQVENEGDLEVYLKRIIASWNFVDPSVTDGKTKGIEICEQTGRKYICFKDPSNLPIEFYIGH